MSPYLVPGGWSKLYSSVMNMRGLLAVLLIPLLCCQDVAGEGSGSDDSIQTSSHSSVFLVVQTPVPSSTSSHSVRLSSSDLQGSSSTVQPTTSITIKLSSVITPSSVSSSSVQPRSLTSVLFSTPSGRGTEMSSPNGTSGFVFWVYVGAPVVIVIAVLSLLLLLICCVCLRKKRTRKIQQLRQGSPGEAYVVQNLDQKESLQVSLDCKVFNLSATTDTFGITSPDNESTTTREHRTLQGYNDVSFSITQRPLKPAQSLMTINTQEPAVSKIKMLSPQLGRKQQRDGVYDVPRKRSGYYSPGENPRYKGPPKKAVSTSALYPAMAQQGDVVDTRWTTRNATGQENVNNDHSTYDVPREARLNAAVTQASSANHAAVGHMRVEIPSHYDVPRHALLAYEQSLPPRDIPRVDVEKREVKTLPPNAIPPKGHYYDIPKNTEARGGYHQPKRSNPDTGGRPHTGSRQTETSYSTYDVPKRAFTLPPESSGHYDVPKLALAAEQEKRKIGRSESSPVHSQSGNIQRRMYNPLPPRLGTSKSLHNVPSQVLEESDSDPDHIYDEPPIEVVQEAIKKRYAHHRGKAEEPVVNGMGHRAKRSASHHEISTRTPDYENVNYTSRAPPPVRKKTSVKSPSARKKWPYN